MTTVSRAYVSRLAGLTVFDPNGDRVGKVRDVVVALRVGTAPPRVLGLVVEVVARRRIFVPMGRVTAVDPGAVMLASGTLNLKRFEQRAGETLVLGELLDRTVRILESGKPAHVVDAGIEQTRTGDWVLSRLAVQEPGRLGRRGQLHQLSWDEVEGLALPQTGQGAETLIATYRDLNPADVAHALQELPIKRRHEVAEAMDDERLADVLGELPEAEQIVILGTLEERRAADVLEAMDPDDAADLLAELSNVDRNRLLELMEPDEAEPVRQLLKYSEDTAGGMMTSEPVILAPDATIAEALARVREPRADPGAGQPGVRLPTAVGHPHRALPRPRPHPAAAARAAVHPGQRRARRPRAAPAGGPARRGDPLLRDLQPGRRAGRRRAGPAGRRGQRRRRPRPPAARRLARAGPSWLTGSGSTSPADGPAASRASSG